MEVKINELRQIMNIELQLVAETVHKGKYGSLTYKQRYLHIGSKVT